MKYQNSNIKPLHKTKSLCYNGIMLKTKTKVKMSLAGSMLAVSAFMPSFLSSFSSAAECTSSPCSTTFQVNVKESLSVTITNDHTSESTGNVGDFLRNKIDVNVATNNSNGFAAYMHSKDSTNLVNAINSGITIPTLASGTTRGSFTNNYWGYSVDDTAAGSSSSNYSPMSTSNITLISAAAGTTTGNQTVYFGTKTDTSQASGTYLGTVVINVITGSPATNPTPSDPTDPATPQDDTPNDNQATYVASSDRTVYTTTSTNSTTGATTTTTQVSDGNTTSSYAAPAGETLRTDSNISENGSTVATGLAVAATIAAASGGFFFILAKRKEDEEEDESELQS